jgi:hypothetical protein
MGDILGAAVSLPRLDFVKRPGYLIMAVDAIRGLLFGGVAERLNGIFWIGVLLLTALLGVTSLRSLVDRSAPANVHPLPVVALFYALVSVHYQVPIYLFCAAGLSLTALLWLATEPGRASRAPALWSAAILAVIAVYYQAAMPLSRGLEGIVAGERRPVTRLQLPRAGLYVDPDDATRYSRLVRFIQQETLPGDTILALPSRAELYFLAKRTNPFRFYNAALGIRSSADLDSVLQVVRCRPPKLVFYDSSDKYNTAASARVGEFVRARYETLPPLPPFQVFRRRPTSSSSGGDRAACDHPGR